MRDFLQVTIPVFGVGGIAFWWAGRRVSADLRRARWIKFATYVLIVHAMLAAAMAGRVAITTLMGIIGAAGFIEIVRASRRLRGDFAVVVVIAFAVIAGCAVAFGMSARPLVVAYVYLIVAGFDGFSQAGGQLAGRRRLAPSVSPGKTVEGFLIGVGGAMSCALLFRGATSLSIGSALLLAVTAAVAGVAGDLMASWVKRRVGVKDFGSILPGHGGVLDRFDSFLTVAALAFAASLFR